MSLVMKTHFVPAVSSRQPEVLTEFETTLNVTVVFTTVNSTLAALSKAGDLASRLNARIILLVPEVVPYPLALEDPPIPLRYKERLIRVVAGQSSIATSVHLYLCRDRLNTVLAVLAPRSLVVVGGPRRRWLSSENRMARALKRAGHEVIFAEGK